MIIRYALETDLPSVQQIYCEATEISANPPVDFWRALISAQGLMVAAEAGRVMGFGTLEIAAEEQIRHLYVAPDFQGRGAGGKILSRLEEQARTLGVTEVKLHAAPGAVEFYRRAGYTPIAPDAGSTHDHDGVLMTKSLTGE